MPVSFQYPTALSVIAQEEFENFFVHIFTWLQFSALPPPDTEESNRNMRRWRSDIAIKDVGH